MTERMTEDTPCTLCGEPLGMDSGHHITGERDEHGDFYHVACLEATRHAETQTKLWQAQQRIRELEDIAIEALAYVESTVAAGVTPSLAKRLQALNDRFDAVRKPD